MEHRHDLHGRLLLGNIGIAGTGVTDDADILVKVDGVHLAQLAAACDGLEDAHGHGHLDVALHGTGHALLDEHGEGRDQHTVQHTGLALCKAVIVGSDEGNLLILDPLLKGHDILCHVPDLFNGAATLDVESVQNILCLSADGVFIGDVVSDGPHLLPVELLGVEEHPVVQVGFVNVQVHHAGIRTTNLCQIGVAEAAAHLCGTAPVLDLSLHLRVAALDHAGDNGVTLASALQVGHHLADCTAGVQLAQPSGSVRIGVVRGFLLLDVHENHGHVQVAHSGQHIVRSSVGQQLQNDQINVSGAELVACGHGQFLGGDDAAINDFYAVGDGLFEVGVLLLKFGYEGRELGQIGSQSNGEHANTGFGFNEHGKSSLSNVHLDLQIADGRRLNGQSHDLFSGIMGGQFVQGGVLCTAACDVQFIPVLAGDFLHLTIGFAIAVGQRVIDAVDEVCIRSRSVTRFSKSGANLCAHVLRRGETGFVHIKNAGVGAGLGQFHHLCKGDAQLLLHTLDDPQAHDVFQVADVPHTALIGEVGFAAFRRSNGACQLDTQQAPCAGGQERCIALLHRDALHGTGRVVGSAQHHIGPPASAAMSAFSGPSTVPGAVNLGNMVSGRPSALRISGSYSLVCALTRPVEVALVYSRAFTPQSFQSRYSGIIRKSSACSSRPAFLSAYS